MVNPNVKSTMVFASIYNYLFASDLVTFQIGEGKNKKQVVLRVGDQVSVYSERFSCWFNDGMITATFRDRVKVRYGIKKYFGWTLSRGNEKTVMIANVRDILRPHKLYAVTDTNSNNGAIFLAAPAATTSVKSGEFHAKPVAVKKAV